MKKSIVNKAVLLLAAFPLFFLAGCDRETIGSEEPGDKTGTSEIHFEIDFAPPTRATTDVAFRTTWEDGDRIGIFAVRHASGNTGTLAASGNYIHNVALTYNATAGTWTGELYFPQGDNELDFYAYYPYSDAPTNPTNITFNVKTDQRALTAGKPNYNASDLMMATPVKNIAKGTTVTLTFAHALALVEVTCKKNYAGNIGPEGDMQVTLLNMQTGATLNLGSGTGSVTTTGTGQTIKMARVAGSQTYRALVPAQDVAKGTQLFLLEQFNELYSHTAVAASLASSTVKQYEMDGIPFIPTVEIKKGTFQMGSPETEPNRGDNETLHQVELTDGFRMSRYEITNAQYAAFLNATSVGENRTATVAGFGSRELFTLNQDGNVAWNATDSKWEAVSGKENHPMMQVTWYGAKAFADWVGGKLPTEAQWEYACRAGTATAWSFGDGEADLTNYGWYGGNSGSVPHQVGGKSPNVWGLYDMHGNMWEWCLDQTDWPIPNYGADAVTDPLGTSGSSRVLRGGSWLSGAQYCRSACRNNIIPDFANSLIGFRVVFAL